MLEIQNNLYQRSIKRKLTNKNLVNKNYNIAAEYLSEKFVGSYNLRDPSNDISKHLKKIFMHFFKHNVQNIDLIKVYSKDKLKSLEFKVNIFYNVNILNKTHREKTEIISVKKFFNKNIQYILI